MIEQTQHADTVLIDRQAETKPNSALSSNSEFAHAGPRPLARWYMVLKAGYRRILKNSQWLSDQHPVAIELSQQFNIRRLPQPEQAPEYSNSGVISCDVRYQYVPVCYGRFLAG